MGKVFGQIRFNPSAPLGVKSASIRLAFMKVSLYRTVWAFRGDVGVVQLLLLMSIKLLSNIIFKEISKTLQKDSLEKQDKQRTFAPRGRNLPFDLHVRSARHLSLRLHVSSEATTFASLFAQSQKKKKNHWPLCQSWSRISSISVLTNKQGAYLCTYSTQRENQQAWKHQVREKKNSHWLHMLLNASASRSCCSQAAAHFALRSWWSVWIVK